MPYEQIENIYYAKNFSDLRKADLYIPDSKTFKGCILMVHGGGWKKGNKEQWASQAKLWATKGYVTMCTAYRLAPTWNIPAQIEDIRLSIQFLKLKAASLGCNPKRLAVIGSSAGAHLALLMASIEPGDYLGRSKELMDENTVPQVVIAFNPVCSVEKGFHNEKIDALVKTALSFDEAREVPAFIKDCSPYNRVKSTKSNILIIQGSKDTLTTPESVIKYFEEINSAGVPSRYQEIKDAEHGFAYGTETLAQKESIIAIERFFSEFLI